MTLQFGWQYLMELFKVPTCIEKSKGHKEIFGKLKLYLKSTDISAKYYILFLECL